MKMKMIIDEGGFEPIRGHADDAGLDLRTPVDFVIKAHDHAIIDTNTHILIPKGYYGQLFSKSGLNVNHSIVSLGGTIDAGYKNSIKVKLYNFGDKDIQFKAGDKLVQIVFMSCITPELELVEEFTEDTERGGDGFGSTGR